MRRWLYFTMDRKRRISPKAKRRLETRQTYRLFLKLLSVVVVSPVFVVFMQACDNQDAVSAFPSRDIEQSLVNAVPPLPENASHLSDFPAMRVTLADSRRDGYDMPAGVIRIDMPTAAGDETFSFSLLPREGGVIQAVLYQQGRGLSVPVVTGDTAWSRRRAPVQGGVPLSLVLESETPFYLASCSLAKDKSRPPAVLIYLIDTLRQDHVGCYKYPLDTTPHIDRFAKEAIRFNSLTPMASWTRPSVASLLTGAMDYTHHALSHEDHLRKGVPSLAKSLEQEGWVTHGITTNTSVSEDFGFGTDFQWYEEVDWQRGGDVEAVDRGIAFLAESEGLPFFLFMHLMAPHREYTPPPEYKDSFMPDRFVGTHEQARIMKDMALYDAEIRFSDDLFGRMMQALKDAGRYEDALIVLLSDHGEQFMEHGDMAHGNSLHYEEMTVPLIFKMPGNVHAREALVRHIVKMADVAPTILEVFDRTVPAEMNGRSFLPLITLEGLFPPEPAFARLRIHDVHYYMAQTETVKYIRDVVRGEDTWYDLHQDLLEQKPLRTPPDGGETLKSWADAQAALPVPDKGEGSPALTAPQIEEFKALGYL